MFKQLMNKLQHVLKQKPSQHNLKDETIKQHSFSANLNKNIQMLKEIFNNSSDVIFREFEIALEQPINALLVYIDGLVNDATINENVLKELMFQANFTNLENESRKINLIDYIRKQKLNLAGITETEEVTEAINSVLSGSAILLIDGEKKTLILSVKGWAQRGITEPETETIVRGPRDGFVENLRTNSALIRRRLATSRLKFERVNLGVLTKTNIDIVYIQGVANEKIVDEVKKRLGRINTDSIMSSGQIEEFILDSPYSPFPQVVATERPDKVAGYLTEGHVAIICDSTPFVLLVPVTFYQFMQSTEDYYNNYIFSTAIRLLRFFALNVALLLPSLYIAIVTFHQEMLPTPLLISIAAAREGVPFPAFVEALIMEFTFEVLREAGVRLPRPVGQAVSIVGALVIGEAAVTAGLVSPAMVIIVSLTAVASFTIPSPQGSLPIRLLRFPMMVLAGALGLYGIMIGLMAVLVHLCSLRSFGIPYISPIAPTTLSDLKDVLVRVPWFKMTSRPKLVGQKNPKRQDSDSGPDIPPLKD